MSFHVGQRVICVDTAMDGGHLEKGREYAISSVFPHVGRMWVTVIGHKWSWFPERFRPVRETSIECFRQLLNPTPDDVERLRERETV